MAKLKLKLVSSVLGFLMFGLLGPLAQAGSNPSALWVAINSGWSGVYADLAQQLDARKSYVVWSIIAPLKPMDLRKPDFFREFISGSGAGKGLSISHNLVAWQCHMPNGEVLNGATGMSGETQRQSAALVKSGHGLTTFLATFKDGWLSPADQTAGIWLERGQREDIYNVVVEVSSQDCANMLGFLKKFVFHKNRPVTKFGLTQDPAKFEGGGCISFASVMLEKAGVLKQLMSSSKRTLRANHYLFGGNDLPLPAATSVPRLPWRDGESKRVGLNHFFSGNWNAGLQGVKLSLLDPELMIWGIKNLSPKLKSSTRAVTKLPRSDIDCQGSPFPECRYRKEVINDSFDAQTQKAGAAARSWKNSLLKKGYVMQMDYIWSKPFVIFTR